MDYILHMREGDNMISGKKRDVERVEIGDIRFSDDNERLLVDFSLICDDDTEISTSVALDRDDFSVYRGECMIGEKKANFQIKKKA